MRKTLLLLLLLPSLLLAESGYRKLHPDGTVEFSDQPIPGGEEIKLRKAPVIRFTPAADSPTTSGSRSTHSFGAKNKGAAAEVSITITSPQADQTLRFDAAGLVVTVGLTPAIQGGQQILIKLDGAEVARGVASRFVVQEVYRGSHTLSASLLGRDGAVLSSSAPITFHIKQRSLYNKEQALPPTPTPTPEQPFDTEGE